MLNLLCRRLHHLCTREAGVECLRTASVAFLALVALGLSIAPARANPWAAVAEPTDGSARVYGKYTAGCVAGAQRLAPTEPGLRAMRLERRRNYGHPALLRYMRALGKHMLDAGFGAVLVGDLSMPRGGPTFTNHISHQSGLDADVWFRMYPAERPLALAQRETLSASSFVDWPQRQLKPNWSKAQTEMLRFTAGRREVQRVFVSAVIKRHLCDVTRGDRTWLAKIRPWYGHADHMHVRLSCPSDSPGCRAQAAVPDGDGCDALDWWLNPRPVGNTEKSKPRAKPILPAACQALLSK